MKTLLKNEINRVPTIILADIVNNLDLQQLHRKPSGEIVTKDEQPVNREQLNHWLHDYIEQADDNHLTALINLQPAYVVEVSNVHIADRTKTHQESTSDRKFSFLFYERELATDDVEQPIENIITDLVENKIESILKKDVHAFKTHTIKYTPRINL